MEWCHCMYVHTHIWNGVTVCMYIRTFGMVSLYVSTYSVCTVRTYGMVSLYDIVRTYVHMEWCHCVCVQ